MSYDDGCYPTEVDLLIRSGQLRRKRMFCSHCGQRQGGRSCQITCGAPL